MRTSIKKLPNKEWLILVDGKSIGIAFIKKDAKFIAKCISKYKKKSGG